VPVEGRMVTAADIWKKSHPALKETARFENPPYLDGRPGDAVLLLSVR